METSIGFVAGLWAAFFQSLAYLASRHFVQTREGGTRLLLTLSHILMGAVSFAILPFFLPEGGIPWRAIAWPLFGTAFFYLLGQFGLMIALRRAQPSQIAPLLALKLLMLALMMVFIRNQSIHALQWTALAACIGGVFVLNYHPHDRLPVPILLLMVVTCLFYTMSDWSILYLTPAFGNITKTQAIMCGSLLCYGFCGLAAVPFLPLYGSRKFSDWRDAVPYSGAWLSGVFGLFASFALVGLVYGGILQSTRTIMGVFLAALLTRLGYTHIEHMKGRSMFIRRLFAAILMVLAVILWAVPGLR